MISGAIALSRGRSIPDELIEDEVGPVLRTVIRRATKVAIVLGLDGPVVASKVHSALGLGGLRMLHQGSRRQRILHRVAQLEAIPASAQGWSRMLSAMSVAGRLDGAFVIDGLRLGRMVDARSLAAGALRGPSRVPSRTDDFVLESSRPAP